MEFITNYHKREGKDRRDLDDSEAIILTIKSNFLKLYRVYHSNYPRFTPNAIKYLLQHINKNMNVFEWGSGISTFWFAKHAKQINTVEHNYYWYSKMINQIDKLKINNIDIVIKPEQNKGEDIDWNKYISSIKDSSNEKDLFDIIVIDGRKRVKCFDICKEYLKKDGIIIFDDSYRKKYNSIYDSNLQYIDYDFGYHRTTVFRNRK